MCTYIHYIRIYPGNGISKAPERGARGRGRKRQRKSQRENRENYMRGVKASLLK